MVILFYNTKRKDLEMDDGDSTENNCIFRNSVTVFKFYLII